MTRTSIAPSEASPALSARGSLWVDAGNRVTRDVLGFLKGFLAQRLRFLGTELHTHFELAYRAAPGWLSARAPVSSFSFSRLLAGRVKFPGTDLHALFRPVSCFAPGWLSERAPVPISLASERCEAVGDEAEGYHLPVFPGETLELMGAGEGKLIIDGTLGGGGHSKLFLEAGAKVLGVDRDPEALAHSRVKLASYGGRFQTFQGNFSEIRNVDFVAMGGRADGMLLDLGVSSRQLDSAARGFSFMREGPLDMRMGPNAMMTAAELVNTWPAEKIADVIYTLGEETRSRRIAAAIVKQREKEAFTTTLQLAACIERAVGRGGRIHPATKSFQAIRMAVNEELDSLRKVLESARDVLKPGGRLLVISFHSLEDRIVKQFLRKHSQLYVDDPTWPEARPNPDLEFRLLSRKAIAPTEKEIAANPRARSAKLRVAQLLDGTENRETRNPLVQP